MKNIIFLIGLFFVGLSLMSNRNGRARTTGMGATTAPGESGQYCGSFGCHFNGVFTPDVKISLIDMDNNIVQKYIPGQDYTVSLKINHSGFPAGYGFQIVSLKDSDNSGINTFSNLTSQMQAVTVNNRQYVEQNKIIDSDSITMTWTAPSEGTGPVSFYGVGNAINGNGNSGGDGADTSFLKVAEDIMSFVSNDLIVEAIQVFPNPVIDFLRIDSDDEILETLIYNANGQIALVFYGDERMLDLSILTNGLYFARMRTMSNQTVLKKLLVQR